MAEEIIRDHGSSIPGYKPGSPEAADYSFKKVKVYQYLGIVYGEIALEGKRNNFLLYSLISQFLKKPPKSPSSFLFPVRDSDARRNYQNEACVALQAAAAADTDGVYWDVLYNLALQLAELGEVKSIEKQFHYP